MAASATASPGPRYAPEDPTLPKPWRGLVDGKTGYLYFWNPETNVTQYERPGSSAAHGSLMSSRPSSGYVSSSAQVQQSLNGKDAGYHDDDDKYSSRGSNGERSHQSAIGGSTPNEAANEGSTHLAPVEAVSDASAEAYRRRHEISVSGSGVPAPLMTFEATGFPSEILKEMRYLLQGGANVVRCAALCWRVLLLECSFTRDCFLRWALPMFVAGLLLVMVQSATWSQTQRRGHLRLWLASCKHSLPA